MHTVNTVDTLRLMIYPNLVTRKPFCRSMRNQIQNIVKEPTKSEKQFDRYFTINNTWNWV